MQLLTVKDVQKILRVSLPQVYRLAERGQLECIRWKCPGNGKEKKRSTVRFEMDVIMAFIENHRKRT